MSLAVVVDVRREDVTRKVTAAIGVTMTLTLTLAAIEQAADGAGRWWLPLACAVACAAWCGVLSIRQGRRRQPLRLQVTATGSLRLLCIGSGEATDAVVLRAWGLGRLIFLRLGAQLKVDPQTSGANDGQSASVCGSAGCLFVLARGSFDECRWHALRRWLVWYRRSRRHQDVAA